MNKSTHQPVVVIPNWNGGEELLAAIQSLIDQSLSAHIIVVDNASTDSSLVSIEHHYPTVEIIRHTTNLGFAGGVNPGIKRAIELDAPYVAPFNDDAIADKHWLRHLVTFLDENPKVGAACPKVLTSDKKRLDSTGDYYTTWGLPYPRGRREYAVNAYDTETNIFAASGAASLYRVKSLKQIGAFDEDFFAYYEDVDLSFRLQLAGWKVAFVPNSKVYHHIGMTSARIKGFTTYQTMKNLMLVWYKNVPQPYFWHVGRRLALAQLLFFGRAIQRGQGWMALKGTVRGFYLLLRKRSERRSIQASKKVPDQHIWTMLVHDLPPNATALKSLRAKWHTLQRRLPWHT